MAVLLIDDDAADAEAAARALGDAASVTHVTSLPRGLLALRTDTYDCVVVDLNLGDGNPPGYAVAKVRQAAPRTPLLALSGRFDLRILRSMVRLGADGYADKADFGQLEDAIWRACAPRSRPSLVVGPAERDACQRRTGQYEAVVARMEDHLRDR